MTAGIIYKISPQTDGKILIGGNFTTFNGVKANRIICLMADGITDEDFNIGTGFNDDVNAIEVQSDGKIILGGKFTNYNGDRTNRIIRGNQDATIDESFLPGSGFSDDAVQVIKIDALGNIMIGGLFTGLYNGIIRF